MGGCWSVVLAAESRDMAGINLQWRLGGFDQLSCCPCLPAAVGLAIAFVVLL
jgi:hypothetical protein